MANPDLTISDDWKLAATPDSDHGDPRSFFGPGVEGIADEQTDPFLVDLANRRKKRFSSSDSGLIIGAYVVAEAARAAGGAEDDSGDGTARPGAEESDSSDAGEPPASAPPAFRSRRPRTLFLDVDSHRRRSLSIGVNSPVWPPKPVRRGSPGQFEKQTSMPSFSHLIPRASDATPPQGGGRRSDSAAATGSGQRRRSRVSPMWDGDRSLGIIKESPETASVRRLNRSRSNESLPSPGRRYRHAIQVLEIRNEQLEKRLAAEQFKHSLITTAKDRQLGNAMAEIETILEARQETERQLQAALSEGAKATRSLQKLSSQIVFAQADKHQVRASDIAPPQDDVTLMFTDVQGSTKQWEMSPETMVRALTVHNNVIRGCISDHDGYEVKTEGDAFMVAFANPRKAIDCAIDIQHRLLDCDWPAGIFEMEDSRIETVEGAGGGGDGEGTVGPVIYRGLRVRCGIHRGRPHAALDPVTGRTDYFGQVVNRASRVEAAADGGQIIASGDVMVDAGFEVGTAEETGNQGPGGAGVDVGDLGSHVLRGVPVPIHLFQVNSVRLRGRTFSQVDPAKEKKQMQLLQEVMAAKQQNADLVDMLAALQREFESVNLDYEALETKLRRSTVSLSPISTFRQYDFTPSSPKKAAEAMALFDRDSSDTSLPGSEAGFP